MKVVFLGFPDSVDTSVLPRETDGITVTDGTNELTDGVIVGHAEVSDPPDPVLIPHTHPGSVDIGPPATD